MPHLQTVLIAGGGPAGLAAAIMLHQQGWEKIVLLERKSDPTAFERSLAFNYQLDGRGQQMLSFIGIDETTVQQYGIANLVSQFTAFGPDGIAKTLVVPFVLADKQTAYWMTRSSLLTMLYQRLKAVNDDGRIELLFGHQLEKLTMSGDSVVAEISNSSEGYKHRAADLILGCDGLNSTLRKCMQEWPTTQVKDFRMVAKASPSSSLMYKVIQLPLNMTVNGGDNVVTDRRTSYIFSSTYKDSDKRLSLFSLPVARETERRTANIILPQSHQFWKIGSASELHKYLSRGFPQLDVDQVFPPSEMEGFMELRPGKFPDPQYSPNIYAEIGSGGNNSACVLLGDTAHSFPPDLGLGVNAALQDVYLFGRQLKKYGGAIELAARQYEKERLPESRALVRLVRKTFPYQYNQVPWRFNLSMIKLLAQIGLAKISRGLIFEPAFRLSQKETLSFVSVERRKIVADAIFYSIVVAGISSIACLICIML